MRYERTVFPLLLVALLGCTAMTGETTPPFVTQLIAQLEAEPKKNPPARIVRYEYRGQVVYYVPPSCCDIPSELYDSQGQVLCSPDGGMTGQGDGKCPDFFDTRSAEHLVWADKR